MAGNMCVLSAVYYLIQNDDIQKKWKSIIVKIENEHFKLQRQVSLWHPVHSKYAGASSNTQSLKN